MFEGVLACTTYNIKHKKPPTPPTKNSLRWQEIKNHYFKGFHWCSELTLAPAEEQTPLSLLERKAQMGRVEGGEGGVHRFPPSDSKAPSLSNQVYGSVVYSTRCSGDKRCWKLHNPLGERSLSASAGAHHRSSRYCPERESANLQTRRGYFNPWQAGGDKWGLAGGGCSPHLPWMWLFQQRSSSGSATLSELQMLSGSSDQNRFDSPSFRMTSTTCNRNQGNRIVISVVPYLNIIHTETTRWEDGLKRTCLKKESPLRRIGTIYTSKSFSFSYRLIWSTSIHIVSMWLIQDGVGVLGNAGSPPTDSIWAQTDICVGERPEPKTQLWLDWSSGHRQKYWKDC